MDHFRYLCSMFVLSLPCTEPCDNLLEKKLVSLVFYCVFVTFQYGVLSQVWCLIVSIPDFCLPLYFTPQDYRSNFCLSLHTLSSLCIHWRVNAFSRECNKYRKLVFMCRPIYIFRL